MRIPVLSMTSARPKTSSDVYDREYPLARVGSPRATAQEQMILHWVPIASHCDW